ncbi:MAG: hypothetical protein QOI99_2096 [Actinomycetota bacterium]|nr:hypothetical protein [Actinomycetota bacterium]
MPDPLMPAAFLTADDAAVRAEAWLLRLQGLQLVLLVVAATVGATGLATDHERPTALLIVGCLVAVWLCRLVQRLAAFEHLWYNGRAAAESVKTLAWRYGMRARPFADDATAPTLLGERMTEVTASVGLPGDGPVVTPALQELRAAPLDERSARYLEERIDAQCQWYTAKSARFRRLALFCDWSFFALTGAAIVTALLLAVGSSGLAVVGLFETAVASVMTWAGVRAYGPTATAYAFTARELQSIRALGDEAARTDGSWSDYVTDAEEAISREHTMWRASRTSTTTAPER